MELKFKVDTKQRKEWFTDISFSHPAKMSLPLEFWIINRYTKEGETILDPMAGIGTVLVGCSVGRNVICVELEKKFCDMMLGNWQKIQQRGPQIGHKMGWAKIIQSDARSLEGLLVDKCIFSPPYGELANEKKNTKSNVSREERLRRAGHNPKEFMGGIARNASVEDGLRYSHNKENIGNLPYGEIDKIITSPPYAEAQSGGGIAQRGYQGSKHSPTDLVGKRSYMPEQAGQSNGQISQLPYGSIDAVISSPPYEDSLSEPEDRKHSIDQTKWANGRKIAPPHSQVHLTYPSSSSDNIGNLKSDSYLQAMLQVYQQCHQVLCPQGLMILVTKNFIRDRKVIRLDLDTIKLCEQAGFSFLERHYRKLPAQSFWRVIYYQKNPEVEKIEKEDILVFRK